MCSGGGSSRRNYSAFRYFEPEMEEKPYVAKQRTVLFRRIPTHIRCERSEFCGRRHGVERMRSWHSMNIYFSGFFLYSTCVERIVWWWWWYALSCRRYMHVACSNAARNEHRQYIYIYRQRHIGTICNVSNFRSIVFSGVRRSVNALQRSGSTQILGETRCAKIYFIRFSLRKWHVCANLS